MNYRIFASQIEVVHRNWASETFHIPKPEKTGIDLADEEIGIELKCRLSKYTENYAIHAYQISQFEEENFGKELYWGFINYSISKNVINIHGKDKLKNLVIERDITIIPWKWIKQFPISHPKTGPYVYAKKKNFPTRENMNKIEIENNKIYMPRGCLLEEKINSLENIKKYDKLSREEDPF